MFDDLIEEARKRRKRLAVYTQTPEQRREDRLRLYDVDIEYRQLPPAGPAPFVAIYDGGDFAGAIDREGVEQLLAPPVVRPGSTEGVSEGYRALFDVLAHTLVTTRDRNQLLAASRELEDRAFRVGAGTFRASFQRLSAFETQVDAYRHLASGTGLDIHIYGAGDWTPPDIEGITYHLTDDPAVTRHWAIAFDGGGNDQQACGLAARETDGEYTGFWTYDPDTVEEIATTLDAVD